MQGETYVGTVGKVIFICGACLFLSPQLLWATCEANGFCYVTPAGAGAKTGVDWNNAYADLPSSLTRGVVYFLGGSSTSYASHNFNDADSGTTLITIYKAVDCTVTTTAPYCTGQSAAVPSAYQPQNVAGWQASFGTSAALWEDTANSDPETLTRSYLNFCSDYYVFDGVTGSTSPTGPGGQGFVLGTQNDQQFGIINIGNANCGNNPSGLTNITLNHLEIKGLGLMPYYQVSVTGCSYNGTSATITTSSAMGGIAGDVVSGWNSSNGLLFINTAATSISSTQVVLPLASSPCASLAFVGLDFLPAVGVAMQNSQNLAETFTNITIENSYIHDLAEAVVYFNGYNIVTEHNYLARNRSTPSQHSSMLEMHEGSTSTTDGPQTIAYNFVLDPVGTGVFTHLGVASSCSSNCGTLNGLSVYGNVFTCHASAPSYQCGVGEGTVNDNGATIVQNLTFYNNTVANMIGPQGVLLQESNSTGGIAEDNLFYAVSGSGVEMQGPTGFIHDYNTILNSAIAYGTTCNTNETCTTSGSGDPFVNDSIYNFQLTADMNAASNSGTAAAQGVSLSSSLPSGCTVGVNCYNIDFNGATRGADGTWERGAYEFNTGALAQKPNPPTNLRVVSVQ